jgi:hypothetical protein
MTLGHSTQTPTGPVVALLHMVMGNGVVEVGTCPRAIAQSYHRLATRGGPRR